MLDVRLPDGDGVSVCRDIRSKMPEVACLMLTSFGDDEALFDAIMAGAAGYVLKQIRGTDLVGAVRTVASGESLLDPEAASRVMRRMRDQAGAADPLAGLTAQERRILELIGEGLTNRQIGERMYPGREDGQELRFGAVRQAGYGTPHAGRRLRRPCFRGSGRVKALHLARVILGTIRCNAQ